MPDNGPGHLRAFGIGEAEEEAYELLLSYPHSDVEQLAERWERAEALTQTLAELATLGLAERLPGDPPRYLAVPPGAALGGYLSDLEEQFKTARDRVTELTLAYRRYRAAPDLEPGTVIEAVTGRAAVLRRIEQITAVAREQVRSLDVEPYPPPVGVTHRAIYHSAAIGELTRSGQEARVLPNVPLCLYLVDHRFGLLPSRQDTLLVVYPSALLGALSELFESLWSRALPLPSGQDRPAADHELISLLLAGLTDTASARHLGVSQRTVQRRVAALLDELGVQTRFQAGAKLAFRDAHTGEATDPTRVSSSRR